MNRRSLLALVLVLLFSSTAFAAKDLKPWNPPDYFIPAKFAQVNGLRVAYIEAGSQNPRTILFIHGHSGDAQTWWDEIEYFKSRYHVVAIDVLGHGRSERRQGLDYSMENCARMAVGLLDHLKVEKAVIVGNSMGGQIAEIIAIRHPERVEKLVLVDAAGSNDFRGLFFIAPIITPTTIKLITGQPTSPQFEGEPAHVAERHAFSTSTAGTTEEPIYLDALARTIKDLALHPVKGELHKIKAETLLIWGDNDQVVNPKAIKTFSRLIPNTKVHMIHEGGHVPHRTKPQEFNCALDAFLDGKGMEGCRGK